MEEKRINDANDSSAAPEDNVKDSQKAPGQEAEKADALVNRTGNGEQDMKTEQQEKGGIRQQEEKIRSTNENAENPIKEQSGDVTPAEEIAKKEKTAPEKNLQDKPWLHRQVKSEDQPVQKVTASKPRQEEAPVKPAEGKPAETVEKKQIAEKVAENKPETKPVETQTKDQPSSAKETPGGVTENKAPESVEREKATAEKTATEEAVSEKVKPQAEKASGAFDKPAVSEEATPRKEEVTASRENQAETMKQPAAEEAGSVKEAPKVKEAAETGSTETKLPEIPAAAVTSSEEDIKTAPVESAPEAQPAKPVQERGPQRQGRQDRQNRQQNRQGDRSGRGQEKNPRTQEQPSQEQRSQEQKPQEQRSQEQKSPEQKSQEKQQQKLSQQQRQQARQAQQKPAEQKPEVKPEQKQEPKTDQKPARKSQSIYDKNARKQADAMNRGGSQQVQGPRKTSFRKVSVVVPLYNEEESLWPLANEIKKAFKLLSCDYEVILVDDGSTDKSLKIIKDIAKSDSHFRYVSFRKNYGKSAALQVGFKQVNGDAVITMDADLQDDPHEIPNLIQKLEEGYDLVSGWKKLRYDPFVKRHSSKFFNYVTGVMSGIKIHDFNCGLKAYRREVVRNLNVYGELHRYMPVLADWQGFRISEIAVKHHPRRYGKTKFGISRFFKGFIDLLTVMFTTRYVKRPMHLFGFLGAIAFLIGFIVNGYLSYEWIFRGTPLSNRPLLFLGILLIIVGVQFFSVGLLGELIVHNSTDDKEYVIKEKG